MTSIRMGRLIRRIRLEKGITLNDLADEHISKSTISNIERWEGNFTEDKLLCLIDKLEVTWNQLEDRLRIEAREVEDHRFRLFNYEFSIDNGNADFLVPFLPLMEIDKENPFSQSYEYIKGRVYLKKKKPNLAKARKYFDQAIRLSGQYPDYDYLNVVSASYNSLGMIAYKENNLAEALDMYDLGVQSYVENGEKEHYKHILLANKALMLIKLAKFDQADQINRPLFSSLDQIKKVQTKASLYLNQSYIHYHKQQYMKAVEMAKEGLKLAQVNDLKKLGFYLWISLGKTYTAVRNYDRAKYCILSARSISSQTPKNRLFDIRILTLSAKINLGTGHSKRAMEDITQSILLSRQENDMMKLARALMVQAAIHFYMDQTQEAQAILREARNIAKEHEFNNELQVINNHLKFCAFQTF